ncbi:hypothetical protein Y1Q_0005303 [Alligator mississippiensis]|uniref:Uncharacterized protein n=1 Tax=Alligator mississippiensis TaxID=8496 RepID=A0A151MTC4_ALLMI|nr:hypothetical protein Y1Q_0005303 [Alligator mississippiensis]
MCSWRNWISTSTRGHLQELLPVLSFLVIHCSIRSSFTRWSTEWNKWRKHSSETLRDRSYFAFTHSLGGWCKRVPKCLTM